MLPTLIVGGAQLPRISARHKFFGGVDGALGVVALLIRDQLGVRVKHLRTILSLAPAFGLEQLCFDLHCG